MMFLSSLRSVDLAFVAGREALIEDKLQEGQSVPQLKRLLENYLNHLERRRRCPLFEDPLIRHLPLFRVTSWGL